MEAPARLSAVELPAGNADASLPTDDVGLLVDALNCCWSPHFPGEPPMTPAATCTFWRRMAPTTSSAVILRSATFCGSSQMRMA